MATPKPTRSVTFRWSEVKSQYIDFAQGRKGWGSQSNLVRIRDDIWNSTGTFGAKWVGNTTKEMVGFLRDGYTPPEMAKIDHYTPVIERRRQRPADEGQEILADLAWSGDPTPFREWEAREQKPGIRVIAEISLSCATKAEVVADYGAWIGGILHGLETEGYDVELDIASTTRALFSDEIGGPSTGPITETIVRVSDVGEQSDFQEFSPIFAPGGMRTLIFTALGMAGDHFGREVGYELGYPLSGQFKAEWDEDERTLRVHTPNTAKKFPAEQMTQQLRDHGLIP